jgi:hypothetical protein
MKLVIEGSKGVIEDNTCDTLPFATSSKKIDYFEVTPDNILEAAQYVIDRLVKDASSEAVE